MQTSRRIDPRYAVVAGACLTQFVIVGLMFSYSIFFKTFEEEFGWSRTTLSAALSLAFVMMGLLAGVMGHLGDRLSPRLMLAINGILYGLGFALISQVSEPCQLFARFAIFIGLGMSTHDVVTLSTVARYFDKRRGIMTGVVKTGTAAGQIGSNGSCCFSYRYDRLAISGYAAWPRRCSCAAYRIGSHWGSC